MDQKKEIVTEIVNGEPDAQKTQTPAAPAAPLAEAPAAPAAPSQQDEFAKRFTELTRREREAFRVSQENKQLKDRLAALEKKEALKKENPYAYLKEEGIDFDTLAQSAIKENEPDSKIAALEKQLADFMKKDQDRVETEARAAEEKQNTALVQRANTEISDLVKAAGEKYEILNGDEDIMDTLYQVFSAEFSKHYESNQVPFFSMPDEERKKFIENCADKVESYYEGKIKKLLGSSKRLGLLKGDSPKPDAETKGVTLTSTMTPATPAPTGQGKTLRPVDEEIRRIAAEFKMRNQTAQR